MKSFSHSEYHAFKNCRRNWWLRYVRCLDTRPEDESPVGVRQLGINVHLALEGYFGYNLDPLAVLRVIYHETVAQHPEAEVDIAKEAAYALTMVSGFMDWVAETGMEAEYDVIATEGEVSYELDLGDGQHVLLRGHIDQVVQRRGQDAARLVRDFKTVGSLIKADELQRDEQMRFYAMLQWLRAAERDERVDGVLYTMLLRSKRTTRATPPFYATVPIHYNEHDHRSMLSRVRTVAREAIHVQQLLELGEDHHAIAYPNPSNYCGWGCPFRYVCTLADDGSRFEDALASNFVQVDPYGYYGTDRIDHVRKLLEVSDGTA